jgi:hypothetical protein
LPHESQQAAATNLVVGLSFIMGKKTRFYRGFFENRFKQRKPAVPVVAVAVPFQSTVQSPFSENGASVTGI